MAKTLIVDGGFFLAVSEIESIKPQVMAPAGGFSAVIRTRSGVDHVVHFARQTELAKFITAWAGSTEDYSSPVEAPFLTEET